MSNHSDANGEGDQPAPSVRGLENGLAILAALAGGLKDPSLIDVARHCNLSKATAFRLLATLERLGYVQQDSRTKRYRLGLRVLDLGSGYISNAELPDRAQPYLEQLARDCDESASLCVLDGADVVHVARAAIRRVYSATARVGSRFPAYHTAAGKALLAYQPEERLAKAIALTSFEPVTPKTITSPDALRCDLEQIRRQGYAVTDGEGELGIVGIAAPVCDGAGHAVASVSTTTSTSRTPLVDVERRFVPHVVETAAELSRIARYPATPGR